jgi:hypothetical protein
LEPAFRGTPVVESSDALRPGHPIEISETKLNLKTIMKPTPQTKNQNSARNDDQSEQRKFPLTDHSYHATAEAVSRSSGVTAKGIAELRTFRKVSREFFDTEAHFEYAIEAIFFAWILATAAWPVSVMIRQLITMMI